MELFEMDTLRQFMDQIITLEVIKYDKKLMISMVPDFWKWSVNQSDYHDHRRG